MKTIIFDELSRIVNRFISESPASFKIRTHKCYARLPPQTHADLFIEPRTDPRVNVGVNVMGEMQTLYTKLMEALKDYKIESTYAIGIGMIAFTTVPLSCNVAMEGPPKFPTRPNRRKTDPKKRPRY